MTEQPKSILSKDKATSQHGGSSMTYAKAARKLSMSEGLSSQYAKTFAKSSIGVFGTTLLTPSLIKHIHKNKYKNIKITDQNTTSRLKGANQNPKISRTKLKKQLDSLVGLTSEEAAEEATYLDDVVLTQEQSAPSATPQPSVVPSWEHVEKAILPKCKPGQEIVVDKWHVLGAGYYVIDQGDGCQLSYTLPNGNVVQGYFRYVRVGEKVDVRFLIFARSVDKNWREKPSFCDLNKLALIRKYSNNILCDSIGKNDLPLVFLNQRLQGFIVSAGYPKWEGMTVDIHHYLMSEEFLNKVEDYHKSRTSKSEQVLRIKARIYVNKNPEYVKEGELFIEKLVHMTRFTWRTVVEACSLSFPLLFVSYVVPPLGLAIAPSYLYWFRNQYYDYWFSFKHRNLYDEGKLTLNYASVLNVRQRCSQGIKLPEVLEGVQISSKKDLETECDTSKKLIGIYGCVLEDHPYVIPTTCHHNLYNGLRIRFCFDRSYASKAITDVVSGAISYVKKCKFPSFSGVEQMQWIGKFPTKRRLQLLEAKDQGLVVDPVADLFVKREPYVGKFHSFKPRQIWNPKPSMMVWIGPVFAQINDYLARHFNIHHQITIDCGLTAEELGGKASECSSRRRLLEMDVSNWDGSLVEEWNEFEEFLVSELVEVPEIRQVLMSIWRKKKGHGQGVKVSSAHGRRSGDPWTSCFNGIINAMIVWWVFRDSTPSLLIVVKGDDNFVGVNSDLSVQSITHSYLTIGMTVEIKEVSLYELGYCSGKFWPTVDGPKWGVCPFRVLAKLGINLNNHPTKVHKRLLKGTMISLLPIALHVPIVGKMFYNLINSSKSVVPLFIDDGYQYKNSSPTLHLPVADSYYWLSSYSGATVEEIEELEDLLSKVTFEDFPFVLSGELISRIGRKMYGHEGVGPHYSYMPRTRLKVPKVPEKFAAYGLSLVSALVEECLRFALPMQIPSVAYSLTELSSGNNSSWILHLVNSQIDSFSLRLGLHMAWNSAAFLSLVSSGSVLSLITKKSKTNNKQGKNKGQKNNRKNKRMQDGNPIRSAVAAALRAAGAGIGGLVAGPSGSAVGRNAGAWVSKVIGSGDYSVSNNSLVTTGVPEFAKAKRIVTIKHREYLGDITGSTAFSSRSWSLNPGDDTTFPWLSGVASNFQQYRFKGLLFEFVSTSADALNSTNTALGTVVMATQYNVNRPNFVSKQEMEAYEFSCSTRPSASLLHPIECNPDETPMTHLYVRSGTVPSGEDARMYDLGKFQLATVGMQAAATIGELWVTYDIELLKPRLNPYGTYSGEYTRIKNGAFTNSDMFSAIQTVPTGDLGVTIGSSGSFYDRIVFPSNITMGRFFVHVLWRGTGAVLTLANPTLSNCTAEAYFDASTGSFAYSPNTGATSSLVQFSCVVTINGYNAAGSYLQFAGLTLPTSGSAVTISVISLEPENWV